MWNFQAHESICAAVIATLALISKPSVVCLGAIDRHKYGKARGCGMMAWDCRTMLLLCSFLLGMGAPLFCACNGTTPDNVARIFVCLVCEAMMEFCFWETPSLISDPIWGRVAPFVGDPTFWFRSGLPILHHWKDSPRRFQLLRVLNACRKWMRNVPLRYSG